MYKIHEAHSTEESKNEDTPFAEYWMGDHVNGPSSFRVTQEACQWMEDQQFVAQNLNQSVQIGSLVELNPEKYVG